MEIRKILKKDCSKKFETGLAIFDYNIRDERLDLNFYYQRSKQEYEVYVIADSENVRALLCYQMRGMEIYFSRLGVDKKFQDQGYMAQMLDFGIQQMENMGIKIATAKVIEDLAQVLEEKWNFEIIGWREDDFWGRYAEMRLKRS